MKKLLVAGALALGAAACAPEINDDPPVAAGPTANFDPSLVPAVVPSPNELAIDPATGKNKVTPPPEASDTDRAFIEYLATLDGFPVGSSASVTFSAPLDPASVAGGVKVLDLTANAADVTNTVTTAYAQPPDAKDPRVSVVPPPSGWKRNNRYGVIITTAIKGADGKPIEPSATWTLVRSEQPLVSCPNNDLASPDCRPTTQLIPSTERDPAARAADIRNKALGLERLRLLYKPLIEASGVPRDQVALAWTFKIASNTALAFDPSTLRVPTPNDLAISSETGLVTVGVTRTADGGFANANDEFTAEYLNTLNGFPQTAGGAVAVVAGDLDPATVRWAPGQASSVIPLSMDMTAANPAATLAPCVTCTVEYVAAVKQLVVRRPTPWAKGTRVIIAVTKGVRDTAGNSVEPSTVTWQLVRSRTPVANCPAAPAVPTAESCTPNFKVSALTNAEAARLETLRRGYAPLFAGLEAQPPNGLGIQREQIAVLWTYSIVNQSEVVFDPNPADPAIPFPVSIPGLTMVADGGVRVALPVTGSATEQALITGLNTLDGFSTTAPIVTEGDADRGALDRGAIDGGSLAGNAGVRKVGPASAAAPGTDTPPSVTVAYLPAVDGQAADGGVKPATLAFVPNVPLDERTRYVAYTTTDVRTADGRRVMAAPAFALLRLRHPLVDGQGKSTVSGVPDATAAQLEPLRQYFNAAVLTPLTSGANGLERSKIAHAFPFHTQTTVSALPSLAGYPGAANIPTATGYLADISTTVAAGLGGSLPPGVGQVLQGTYVTPNLLTGPGGTINTAAPRLDRIPFWLILPAAAPTGEGYDLTVFGHGLGRNRQDVLSIASALTGNNRAVLAIDWVTHGDRSVCTADADCATGTCSRPTSGTDFNYGAETFGRCVSGAGAACTPATEIVACAGQGRCLANNTCEGGSFAAAASGKALFSAASPFGTRDNLRQHVVDLQQLLRVVSAAGFTDAVNTAAGRTDVVLNTTRNDYVGQSLGGIFGTTWTAASGVRRSALNVPGGDLVSVVLEAEGLASLRASLLAALPPQGTPEFDRTVNIFRWILDPSDPSNAALWLENRPAPVQPNGRNALIQYIVGDQVVPNKNNVLLINAANRPGQDTAAPQKTAVACWNPTDLPLAQRHGFLLNGFTPGASELNQTVTLAAQTQAVTFLASGTAPDQSAQGTCPAGLPR